MSSDKLAADILAALKALLGDRWAKFKASERQLLQRCADDAAALTLEIASGQLTPAQAQREKVQLVAQVANVRSAGEAAVAELFWSAVRIAVKGALAVVLA